MCYLSTDRVIEDIPFDENDRQFNHQRVEERLSHLTKRFIYYCGSSLCCGCGFVDGNITEEILQRTDQEFQNGELSDETVWLWWNQLEPPPKDKDEFDESAKRIRESHRDTTALHRLIVETCTAGFDCELLVCWAGNENNPLDETFLVHPGREEINVDFRIIRDDTKVFLYHFVASSA
jgi:hypothetical protein